MSAVRNAKILCAIYTRKSTNEGLERDFNSLDAQREGAEAYIQSQASEGWSLIVDRYDDGGFSGRSLDRPALRRLLEDIRGGKVHRILVYKIDRLSRSLLGFAELAKIFEDHGVGIVSVTQQLDTATSMGRLTLNMLLSFAQFEREMVSDRTRDKLRAARRKGKFTGGLLVLGYDRHPGGGQLLVNEEEALRIRDIFKVFLATGCLADTVQTLNARGWTLKQWTTKQGHTYGGGSFDKINLKRLLTQRVYLGEVAFEGRIIAAEHPAILDRRDWDAAQERLRAFPRRHTAGKAQRPPALLAGILKCGPCAATMTRVHIQKGGRTYAYYVCMKAHTRGWASCPTKAVSTVRIETFVLDSLTEMDRAQGTLGSASVDVSGPTPGAPPFAHTRAEELSRLMPNLIERIDYDGQTRRVTMTFRSEQGRAAAYLILPPPSRTRRG